MRVYLCDQNDNKVFSSFKSCYLKLIREKERVKSRELNTYTSTARLDDFLNLCVIHSSQSFRLILLNSFDFYGFIVQELIWITLTFFLFLSTIVGTVRKLRTVKIGCKFEYCNIVIVQSWKKNDRRKKITSITQNSISNQRLNKCACVTQWNLCEHHTQFNNDNALQLKQYIQWIAADEEEQQQINFILMHYDLKVKVDSNRSS